MPRKSAAEITTLKAVDTRLTRLQPRDDASPLVKDTFCELVMSVPASHFRPADAPLLELYSQAIVQSRAAYAELQIGGSVTADDRPSPWIAILEKANRAAATLSTRLRLCPQSRLGARGADREKTPPRKNIWEVR